VFALVSAWARLGTRQIAGQIAGSADRGWVFYDHVTSGIGPKFVYARKYDRE
jgi:hypothetical protein